MKCIVYIKYILWVIFLKFNWLKNVLFCIKMFWILNILGFEIESVVCVLNIGESKNLSKVLEKYYEDFKKILLEEF